MDTVLFLHDKPNIQKFYLDLDGLFDESRVNRWISTIMKHKVEEFSLSMMGLRSTSSIFPLSFFTCDSLTQLHLEIRTTLGQFIIPNAVSFPKLKILRLASIDFVDETSARKFFSNCPILEELSLCYCSLYQEFCIVNPTLKHLSITSCFFTQSTVKIYAPNLLTIDFSCDLPGDFVLSSFPSLVEADVHFDIYDAYEYNVFVKLFKKLSSAKLLKLCATSFQVPSEADTFLADFPAFNNLTHLEISSQFCYTGFGRESISTLRRFFRFLQLSPNLESIVFTESIHNPREEYDGCWSLDPICSLPHLKSIKFKYFDGEPVELDAIKLFLKCAGFLETVTIVASLGLSKDHQLNATKMLLMFPKPANCVVKFLTISEDILQCSICQ
ncbi:hypothetical protein MKX03_013626 [Papaver bracteatum]|nr:hypothetical protein MKX03_013626 [Papaver bracteatum]